MSDAEFEYYLEELAKANGLSRTSLKRKLARYWQGRAEFTGSAEDWDTPTFDILIEARKELDDLWVYLSKYLHDRPKDYTKTDFILALKLLAVVEVLLNGQIGAQTAERRRGPTGVADSARLVVGVPALSGGMECWGNNNEEVVRI